MTLQADDRERHRALVRGLAVTFRQAAVHDVTNAAVEQAIRALFELLVLETQSNGPVRIAFRGDSVYVSGELLRLNATTFESAAFLASTFDRLDLREIAFPDHPREDELRRLVTAYQRHASSPTPARFLGEPVGGIILVQRREDEETAAPVVRDRPALVRAWGQLTVIVTRVNDRQRAGGELRLGNLRRAVQLLVDASKGEEPALVALVRMKRPINPAVQHAVATAGLVLLMGRRAGLRSAALAELCLAALLHVGACVHVPVDPTPRQQARLLARLYSPLLPRSIQRAIEVVAELRTPPNAGALPPSAASRLVAVACAYDARTRADPPQPHEEALDAVVEASNRFDPRAASLLVDVLGRFPPGSLVLLTNGVRALVLERIAGTGEARVLTLPAQQVVETGPRLRIAAPSPASLPAARTVGLLLARGRMPA